MDPIYLQPSSLDWMILIKLGDLLSGDLDFDGHQKIESRQQSLQELDKVSYYNILIQSSFWKNCNVTVNFKN